MLWHSIFFPETALGGKSWGGAGWGENSLSLKIGFFLARVTRWAKILIFVSPWREICSFWQILVRICSCILVRRDRPRQGKTMINSSPGSCLATNIASPKRLSTYWAKLRYLSSCASVKTPLQKVPPHPPEPHNSPLSFSLRWIRATKRLDLFLWHSFLFCFHLSANISTLIKLSRITLVLHSLEIKWICPTGFLQFCLNE